MRVQRKTVPIVILAVLVVVGGAMILWLRAGPESPKVEYLRTKLGLVAKISVPPRGFSVPAVLCTGTEVGGRIWIWNGQQWELRQDFLNSAGWGPQIGGRIIVRVPDKPWRAELNIVESRRFGLGRFSVSLPTRRTRVIHREFPPRGEIEREIKSAVLKD